MTRPRSDDPLGGDCAGDVPEPLRGDPATAGPDFVCIGMQKGGTAWLYDQFVTHADFWMPPVKEVSYLSRTMPVTKVARALRRNDQTRWDVRLRDAADRAWCAAYLWACEQPFDLDLYARLFAAKGGRFSGDVSPAYALLPRPDATAIRRRFPNTRIVYIARHPVDRTWSQFCMHLRRKNFARSTVNLDDFLKFDRKVPRWRRHSSVIETVDAWSTGTSDFNFRIFFFDDLINNPELLRSDISQFVTAGNQQRNFDRDGDFNRKNAQLKVVMPPEVRSYLENELRDEILGCAERFGGAAERWGEALLKGPAP